MRALKHRYGFTLLEIVVGITVAGVVLSAVMEIFVQVVEAGQATRLRVRLANEGTAFNLLLGKDMHAAGLGIPPTSVSRASNSTHVALADFSTFDHDGTTDGSTVHNAIRIIGDIPRPQSSYSTFGILHSRPAGDRLHVMWLNDNNGTCVFGTSAMNNPDPSSTTGSCDNFDSIFFNIAGMASCQNSTDVTCPWSLGRAFSGEQLVVASGSGIFEIVTFSGGGDGSTGIYSASLSTGFPSTPTPAMNTWSNDTITTFPTGARGFGYVSTPDRIDYRFIAGPMMTTIREPGRIERRHCWGWENVRNGGTIVNSQCTPYEVVAVDVDRFVLAQTASGQSVRVRVYVRFAHLLDRVAQRIITHEMYDTYEIKTRNTL
jgi:prepilin-type N-terminal cleavage/methylation domain-containing protein